jgi:hypothetical protein
MKGGKIMGTSTVKSVPIPPANLTFQGVPTGRYGVQNLGTKKWHIFEVSRPDHGKWNGWTFLSELHGDNKTPVGWRTDMFAGVLKAIGSDPKHFSAQYGKHTGICGVCSRTLTDPKSIAKGIGPVCEKGF